MVEVNVCPSNGDQPHLDRMLSRLTVYGLLRSANTRSAQYPSRIKPLSATWKQVATLCAVFCTSCSRVSRPSWCIRSDEHTSELQSLMRISYAVFCFTIQLYSQSKIHKPVKKKT